MRDISLSKNWFKKNRQKLTKSIKFYQVVNNWLMHHLNKFLKPEFAIYEMRNGARIKIRANTQDRIAINEVWVYDIYSHENIHLDSTATIIDIGAHIGTFTIKSARMAKNGRVLSYELSPDNYKLLVDNVRLNNYSHVQAFNLGVSDRSGEVTVYFSHNMLKHSIRHTDASHGGLPGIIKTITLDEIITQNNLNRVDLLKIDCEGSEYDILLSTRDDSFDKIKNLVVECDVIDKIKNHETLAAFLMSKSFKTSMLKSPYGGIIIYAFKQD